MDKRVIGFAAAAIVIGGAVLFVQVASIGILASMSGAPTPHGNTRMDLEWRGLWHMLLFTWSLPAALGALLIACFKPRRWVLYSACAIAPDVIFNIQGIIWIFQYGAAAAAGYEVLLVLLVHLTLIPIFLGLYYALIRRHAAA